MQRRGCAPRRRRLLIEHFEPRQMLSAAPSGTDRNVTILENAGYTFAAADFGFSDPGDAPPNAFLAVKLTTRAGLGVVTDDGVPVGIGQFIPLADITAGKLRFTPATNGNGLAYAAFTFQVQDSGGTANGGADLDPTPNTFLIDVTPVNSAPSGRDNNYLPITIGGSEITPHTFHLADFGFSDGFDGPANSFLAVKVTTIPAAGSLTNNGIAVAAGQLISKADIAAGRLRFAVPNGTNTVGPYASFTFQVQDDGGTASGGVDLDPTPNIIRMETALPCQGCIPDGSSYYLAVLEDTAYTFTPSDFRVHSPSGVPQNLSQVQIVSTPTHGALFLNGIDQVFGGFIPASKIASGQLKYIPQANFNSNNSLLPTFSYRAQDDNGLDPTPFSVGIIVASINDAPLGSHRTVTTPEDTAYIFGALDFSFLDPNDSPANLLQAINITSLPATGALRNNGVVVPAGEFVAIADILAGKLTFTPAANVHGPANASLTFRVQDDGGTSQGGRDLDFVSRTLTIDVAQVNDPPSGSNGSILVRDCGDYVFSITDFGFHDPNDSPANNLLAVRIATLPTGGTLTNNGTAVTAGQFISVADILAGRMRFTLTTLRPAEST
jgi:hypothetical protein